MPNLEVDHDPERSEPSQPVIQPGRSGGQAIEIDHDPERSEPSPTGGRAVDPRHEVEPVKIVHRRIGTRTPSSPSGRPRPSAIRIHLGYGKKGKTMGDRRALARTAALIAAGRIEIDFETIRVSGCRVPIWRLEMARRAGSPADSLIKVIPGLTPEGLDQAFAFARRHRDEIDRLIREKGPIEPTPGYEPDDDVDFEKELVELIDRDAEAYERLAR